MDLYNIISVRYIVPAGAEDLDRCAGDIQLTLATGTESFVPLGEETQDPPIPGEVVYKDNEGVICRKMNWREGKRTIITEETKNAIIVIEGFPPVTREEMEAALAELAALLKTHCDGSQMTHFLSREQQTCSLDIGT